MGEDFKKDIFEESGKRLEQAKKIVELQYKGIFIAMAASMFFCLIAYCILSNTFDGVSCSVINNRYFFSAWPQNIMYINNVMNSGYYKSEKCLFFSMRSLMSLTSIPFLFIILIRQFKSTDNYYLKGTILPVVVVLLLGLYTATIPMVDGYSRFRLSINSDFETNILKSAVVIYGIYFCLYYLSYRVPAYFRSTSSNN